MDMLHHLMAPEFREKGRREGGEGEERGRRRGREERDKGRRGRGQQGIGD